MRIDRLELQNFWGFEKFTLDLHPNATVIVGPNGAGKTAIVDAIRVAMEVLPDKFGYKVIGVGHDNVREVWTDDTRNGTVLRQYPSQVSATGQVMGARATWARRLDGPKSRGRWLGAEAITEQVNRWSQSSAVDRPDLPLVALYDVGRKARTLDEGLLHGDTRALLDRKEVSHARAQTRPLDAYEGSMFEPERLSRAIGWMRVQTLADLQEGWPLLTLEGVLQAIAGSLAGVEEVWYSVAADRLMARYRGMNVPVDKLSDGYIAMLGVVADIAWRCAVLNRHHADMASQRTAGIVVIDEIDLHLHPKWQRHALTDLIAIFPHIQFIVTTHSPQVIASCDPAWLRVLVPGADGAVAVETVQHATDLDTNWLLSMVMGAEERPHDAEAALDRLFRDIAAGELPAARSQLAEFSAKWPPLYPELLRAQRLIALAERKSNAAH